MAYSINDASEAAREHDERARLTNEQFSYYDEARRCGACHDDAMEAALTLGYTR